MVRIMYPASSATSLAADSSGPANGALAIASVTRPMVAVRWRRRFTAEAFGT